MKEIPLTQGLVSVVDDEDYERVTQFKWFAVTNKRTKYAARQVSLEDGRRQIQYLHGFILGVKGVDHKDGNGLRNVRENIRPASLKQNAQSHRAKLPGVTSRFRGVSWKRPRRKWMAQIYAGRKIYLGLFTSEIDAALAYDKAAKSFYGEFASLNL